MIVIYLYLQSIIFYTIRSPKLQNWLNSTAITEALEPTLDRQFVDLDPIFNHNLDEDFDFRAAGITRVSFCSVYMSWIQFCYSKRQQQPAESNETNLDASANASKGTSPRSSSNPTPSPKNGKGSRKSDTKGHTEDDPVEIVRLKRS